MAVLLQVDWADLLIKFGLPSVIVIAMGWFFGTKVWPWITHQVEETQKARERDLENFRTQVEKSNREQTEVMKEQTRVLTELTHEVRRIQK